jgi:D-alanyl-D-alanine carboxypeptidase
LDLGRFAGRKEMGVSLRRLFFRNFRVFVLAALTFFLMGQADLAVAGGKFAAVSVDARTGKVLFDSDSNGYRHPASLTKMMTLYLVFEDLRSGRIKLSTPLRVSARAASMAPSKMGLRPGSSITVQQAIYALVIKSANDAAATVAENLGGSESAFAQRMTRKARALGMSRTTYVNASGLPNARQITSARDQATLGLRLMRDFPQYYPYFRATQFVFNGKLVRTHNMLVKRFPGTDGIKTGYVNASGFNVVTSTKRGDKRLVGVVMGGKSASSRDAYMASMLTRTFSKAKDGRTIAAMCGSSVGVIDPLKALLGQKTAQVAQEQEQPDSAAMADAATMAAAQPDDNGGDDSEDMADAVPANQTTPKVIEAKVQPGKAKAIDGGTVVAGQMADATGTDGTAPAAGNLPFQVKKLASQNDVDGLQVASLPPTFALEIGDFKNKEATSDVIAELRKFDAKKLADKDPKTIEMKRKGKTVYHLIVSGYDEATAKKSCAKVSRMGKDCSIIAPQG